jgi:hypothetical protein
MPAIMAAADSMRIAAGDGHRSDAAGREVAAP